MNKKLLLSLTSAMLDGKRVKPIGQAAIDCEQYLEAHNDGNLDADKDFWIIAAISADGVLKLFHEGIDTCIMYISPDNIEVIEDTDPSNDETIDLGVPYLNNTYFLITSELGKNIGVTQKPITKSVLIAALSLYFKGEISIVSISEPNKDFEIIVNIEIHDYKDGPFYEETITLTPTWLYE